MNPDAYNDLEQRLSRLAALTPARRREPLPETTEPCPHAAADRLLALFGAEIASNKHGKYLVARRWYATPEMCPTDAAALRLMLPPNKRFSPCDAEAAAVAAADPAKWLFLDTETTGLAGGTGTYPFLVGLAWWDSGGIQVEQLFMRDYGEEHSLLLEIARRLEERPVLVTFNGKTFDWPLLETRFRMTRSMETPTLAAHLDLLHPSRQLWRWQLNSLRLSELEQHILGGDALGWTRGDDINSAHIPEFYFNYLRGGSADPLAGVFRHNCMDLRGLAALAGRVFRALAEKADGEALAEPLELYGLSRLLGRRGERTRARRSYEHALEAGLPDPVDRTARHELARLARRARDFGRATELWLELSGGPSPSFEACEQMAIHHERRQKDPQAALQATERALSELRRAHHMGTIRPERHAFLRERLERRQMRLEEKLRPNPGVGMLTLGGRTLEAEMRAASSENPRRRNGRRLQKG